MRMCWRGNSIRKMHSKDLNKQLLLGGNDRAETDEPVATVDADRPVTCDADKPLRLID